MKYSLLLVLFIPTLLFALPNHFVYLHDIDSTIQQDIRYAGSHNFVGRPIQGYQAPVCILTKETAYALSRVQQELNKSNLSLKVYDCYRPTVAVEDFMQWSQLPKQIKMQREFYPRVNKAEVFALGYVAERSGHSRGSTVDLTITLSSQLSANKAEHQRVMDCAATRVRRYHDNSLDMGTEFDCFDDKATVHFPLDSQQAEKNRFMLRNLMTKYGFYPYEKEWWHFTLKNEPFKETYFNFKVE